MVLENWFHGSNFACPKTVPQDQNTSGILILENFLQIFPCHLKNLFFFLNTALPCLKIMTMTEATPLFPGP